MIQRLTIKKVITVNHFTYTDFLSKFGVGSAHPGGFELTKEIVRTKNIDNHSHILDVGCGTGQTAAYLANEYNAIVTGIDRHPTMVEKAKKRMEKQHLLVDILHCSIENVPLQNNTFDLVLAESVLSFVNKPTALKEIFRLLKKGGQLIAIEFTINKPLDAAIIHEIKQFYGFESILTEQDWIRYFKQAGFTTVQLESKHPLHPNDSTPEFDYSQHVERELYDIMEQHHEMILKYKDIWDYRVFTCKK